MFSKSYTNFVRPSSPTTSTSFNKGCSNATLLSGKEAKRLYLEEIKDAKVSIKRDRRILKKSCHTPKTEHVLQVTDKDLFLTVQSNNVDKLKQVLDNTPDKINVLDDYGWSLLMIACQANSIETAEELLERNIDTSTRDKAGNSAQSLVIQNKNYILADLLLNCKRKYNKINENQQSKVDIQEFTCEICNKTFPDKNDHLSSTLHNINASKGKKATASYVIPTSNRGYQIMLKVGWDKDTGLGPDGSGKIYPIRTVQKKDRKGLGHGKRKNEESKEDNAKHKNRKRTVNDHQNSRMMEINFRREFY